MSTLVMISAEEFVSLRRSDRPEDYRRAATDTASNDVWMDVIGKFPEMRIWVAHNKTIPIEILSMLARDPDPEVRVAVAMKNKLTDELFSLLATDASDLVRERIVYNKKTPTRILKLLVHDPCESVAIEARRRVALSEF